MTEEEKKRKKKTHEHAKIFLSESKLISNASRVFIDGILTVWLWNIYQHLFERFAIFSIPIVQSVNTTHKIHLFFHYISFVRIVELI